MSRRLQGHGIMTRILFQDFEEFADAINGLTGRFIPTARSERGWYLQVTPVGQVPIQQVQIGGASTFAGSGSPGTLTLGIPCSTPDRIYIDGESLDSNSLILLEETKLFTFAAKQATIWGGITLPLDHPLLEPQLLGSLSTKLSKHRTTTRVQSELNAVTAAKLLVSRLCEDNAQGIELAGAATTMVAEEEIIMAAIRVLESCSQTEPNHTGRHRIPRDHIIRKTLAAIETFAGQRLLIQDLCRATNVSERTLRNVFREYFGVGPMRLLKVRQLHEMRMALTAADPDTHNVSNLALRFGIWNFDAFSRNYVALYGETPSATLRRPARIRDRRWKLNLTWIRYASQRFRDF
ncbi:MAG: helix-turn-helix domain-containing protein [Steroidobacteraceae bacterium]